MTTDNITISLSRRELVFLNSAVLEAIEAIEEWEFQTRTGEARDFGFGMLAQFRDILDRGSNQ